MRQLTRFDTRGLSPAERLVGWGEFISARPNRLVTESRDAAAFTGSVTMVSVGPIRLYRILASPHRLERPAGGIADTDIVRIVIQMRGSALMSQGGHEVTLEPGCWTAWCTHRAHSITNLSNVEQYVLLIPRDWLGITATDVLRQAGNRLGDCRGVGRLVPAYVGRLFDEIGDIDESMHSDIADIIGHLVRLALFESDGQDERIPMRETMRSRMVDYVRHNLRDPDLSIDKVAAKFGCSKRHLHKVFSDDGITLSQFLWSERLERCREALTNPALADRSITEIAFMWGFNSSAHFSKMFKERYGSPPGQWRLQRLGDASGVRGPLLHS